MEKLKKYKKSFWRIPLISVIAGLLYTPCYVRIVLRFGVIEPGVIDSKVSLLTSGGLLIVFLLLGWIALLRNETRMEILFHHLLLLYMAFCYGLSKSFQEVRQAPPL